MNMVLPPKRFQDPADPKYDSIRHLKWFIYEPIGPRLKILKQAYLQYKEGGKPQYRVAEEWNVREREFRDYCKFVEGKSNGYNRTYPHIIDAAYENYCNEKGAIAWSLYLKRQSELWGMNGRATHDIWVFDPIFYPTNYAFK